MEMGKKTLHFLNNFTLDCQCLYYGFIYGQTLAWVIILLTLYQNQAQMVFWPENLRNPSLERLHLC